jgi:hypothetical protein
MILPATVYTHCMPCISIPNNKNAPALTLCTILDPPSALCFSSSAITSQTWASVPSSKQSQLTYEITHTKLDILDFGRRYGSGCVLLASHASNAVNSLGSTAFKLALRDTKSWCVCIACGIAISSCLRRR